MPENDMNGQLIEKALIYAKIKGTWSMISYL